MIIAAVIWYRQHPSHLERLLVSLSGRVDGAVFVDGPYRGLSTVAVSTSDEYDMASRFGA